MVQTDTKGEVSGLKMTSSAGIVLAGLVVSPDSTDKTKDRLYAAWSPAAAVNPAANSGVGLRWTVQFAD